MYKIINFAFWTLGDYIIQGSWRITVTFFIFLHFQSVLYTPKPKNHQGGNGTVENLSGCIYLADQHNYWPFGIIYSKLTDNHPIPTLKAPSII